MVSSLYRLSEGRVDVSTGLAGQSNRVRSAYLLSVRVHEHGNTQDVASLQEEVRAVVANQTRVQVVGDTLQIERLIVTRQL